MNRREFNASIKRTPVEENQPLTRETHAPSSSPPAFGRFRVVHQVGAGVLGPVFRAYDPDSARTVALKSFPLDLTPEQAEQFAAELGRLATLDLSHPSIIAPEASGSEGSTAYLVEDYFVADSVDIALRQYGPAPVPDALRLVGQLAGAIDFAAVAGVHHGALHPRDVLVAPREVRMTGIGVAQALEGVGYRVPGRRPYSAPERLDGAEWGVAADVFSLAVVAHELLTGRRPSVAGELLTADVDTIAAADRAALGEVFARALSARPEDRFPSALAFAGALKHALTGQPLEAPADAERPRRRGARAVRKPGVLPLEEPTIATPDAPVAHADADQTVDTPAIPAREPVPADDATVTTDSPGTAVSAVEEPLELHPNEPPPDIEASPPERQAIDHDLPEAIQPDATDEQAPETIAFAPEAMPRSDPAPGQTVPSDDRMAPEDPSEEERTLVEPSVEAERGMPTEAGPLPSRAADRELPEPPPLTLDDLDIRRDESEPFELQPFAPPADIRPPADTVEPAAERAEASSDVSSPERPRRRPARARQDRPAGEATEPSTERPDSDATTRTGVPRFSEPPEQPPVVPRFTEAPGHPPSVPPPFAMPPEARRVSTASLVVMLVVGILLGLVGGYYFAVRRGAPQSAPPSSPDSRQAPATGQPSASAPASPSAAPSATAPPGAAAPGIASGTPSALSPSQAGAPPLSGPEAKATPARPTRDTKSPAGSRAAGRQPGRARETGAGVPARAAKPKAPPRRETAGAAERTPGPVFEGTLSIVSRPPGARVLFDGRPLGTTPMTLPKVSAGSHVVRLESAGYVTWSGAIQVVAGELNRVTASLDRLPR